MVSDHYAGKENNDANVIHKYQQSGKQAYGKAMVSVMHGRDNAHHIVNVIEHS